MTDENMRSLLGLLNAMVLVVVGFEWSRSLIRRSVHYRKDWIKNQFIELLLFVTVLAILSISLVINRQTQPGISLIVLAILLGYAGVMAFLIWLKYRKA